MKKEGRGNGGKGGRRGGSISKSTSGDAVTGNG